MKPLLDQTLPSNNQQNAMPSRGRVVSKLSSRHNRHKRRGEKSRGERREPGRVPIPSFTPIPEEYFNACGDEGVTRLSEQSRAATATYGVNTYSVASKQISGMTSIKFTCASDDSNHAETDPRCLLRLDESQKRDHHLVNDITEKPICATLSSPSHIKRTCAEKSNEWQTLEAQQIGHLPATPSGNSAAKVKHFTREENISAGNAFSHASTSSASKAVSQTIKLQHSNHAKLSYRENFSSISRIIATESRKVGEGDDTSDVGNKNTVDILMEETCFDAKETTVSPRNQTANSKLEMCVEFLKVKASDLEGSTFPNKSSSNNSMKEASSSHVVKSFKRQNPCRNSDAKGEKNDEMNMKRPDCVPGESRLSDIIEILDDDHDIYQDDSVKSKTEYQGPSCENINALRKNKETIESSQAKRKRKPSHRVSRSSSDSSSKEEFIDKEKQSMNIVDRKDTTRQKKCAHTKFKSKGSVAASKTHEKGTVDEKRSKTSGGKKLCFACVSCKCDGRYGTDATSQFSALSGSNARQEQSLVNRLQRIERDIAWKEGQRHDVARELKKHQLKMLKIWTDSNTIDQKPKFLADADVNVELRSSYLSKLGAKETIRAQRRVFGKQKTHQPTLTQIIRGPKDEDETDEKPPTNENSNTFIIDDYCDSIEGSNCVASAADAHDDFLSFWGDTEPIDSQRRSTMSYYNRALANFNEAKSTGKWAKATATTLQLEDDEGFGALVGLFDSIVCCPRDSTGDDQDDCVSDGLSFMTGPLTPRGESVAKQIKRSIINDPEKTAAIERMCPDWRENIDIAQAQIDPDDLQKALHNVQLAKTKLESLKDRILQAFLDRHQTLEMYEKCLVGSLDRLSGR